ncbi:hypothetical protein BN2476_100109 [Paraburkholderia piptadeniae]|uniref:Uncharacterized protein n=1 Tax=Paraburkholderia piptadeniae TaxID=1701573 RepID=A0A1N7RNZ1_9BURK|nr:hypothetical protein BN2476_100109 [Paraburkholderia piptadeniae]
MTQRLAEIDASDMPLGFDCDAAWRCICAKALMRLGSSAYSWRFHAHVFCALRSFSTGGQCGFCRTVAILSISIGFFIKCAAIRRMRTNMIFDPIELALFEQVMEVHSGASSAGEFTDFQLSRDWCVLLVSVLYSSERCHAEASNLPAGRCGCGRRADRRMVGAAAASADRRIGDRARAAR